jgi:hypothetical protein
MFIERNLTFELTDGFSNNLPVLNVNSTSGQTTQKAASINFGGAFFISENTKLIYNLIVSALCFFLGGIAHNRHRQRQTELTYTGVSFSSFLKGGRGDCLFLLLTPPESSYQVLVFSSL